MITGVKSKGWGRVGKSRELRVWTCLGSQEVEMNDEKSLSCSEDARSHVAHVCMCYLDTKQT